MCCPARGVPKGCPPRGFLKGCPPRGVRQSVSHIRVSQVGPQWVYPIGVRETCSPRWVLQMGSPNGRTTMGFTQDGCANLGVPRGPPMLSPNRTTPRVHEGGLPRGSPKGFPTGWSPKNVPPKWIPHCGSPQGVPQYVKPKGFPKAWSPKGGPTRWSTMGCPWGYPSWVSPKGCPPSAVPEWRFPRGGPSRGFSRGGFPDGGSRSGFHQVVLPGCSQGQNQFVSRKVCPTRRDPKGVPQVVPPRWVTNGVHQGIPQMVSDMGGPPWVSKNLCPSRCAPKADNKGGFHKGGPPSVVPQGLPPS
jgi:hypothetical protein